MENHGTNEREARIQAGADFLTRHAKNVTAATGEEFDEELAHKVYRAIIESIIEQEEARASI